MIFISVLFLLTIITGASIGLAILINFFTKSGRQDNIWFWKHFMKPVDISEDLKEFTMPLDNNEIDKVTNKLIKKYKLLQSTWFLKTKKLYVFEYWKD